MKSNEDTLPDMREALCPHYFYTWSGSTSFIILILTIFDTIVSLVLLNYYSLRNIFLSFTIPVFIFGLELELL